MPPSLDERTVARVPVRLRDDAVQEAWLAYLGKRNPNTAVAAYVNRCRRHRARWWCFSDLEPEHAAVIRAELWG